MTNASVPTLYSGRSTNWPAMWVSLALMAPLVLLAKDNGSRTSLGVIIGITLFVGVALVNLITASSVRAIAGTNGVTVHFGVFGWPRFRYPIGRIQRAEAIEIPSTQLAWGIYWTPWRGLMLTLRNGPALRLTLVSGRKVTISTPDPDAAVRAIDAARR